MSGYRDWDHILAGTLIPLIYHGAMHFAYCTPCTIAGANVWKATKFTKKKGLPSYKERRAQVTSMKAWAIPAVPLVQRSNVKSKVIMLLGVQSSLSGEGRPVVTLDRLADSEKAPAYSGVGAQWVIYGSCLDMGSHLNPMWHTKD